MGLIEGLSYLAWIKAVLIETQRRVQTMQICIQLCNKMTILSQDNLNLICLYYVLQLMSSETTGGDKRKKYTSYDINIHNS